jgi:hypothetical protein
MLAVGPRVLHCFVSLPGFRQRMTRQTTSVLGIDALQFPYLNDLQHVQ